MPDSSHKRKACNSLKFIVEVFSKELLIQLLKFLKIFRNVQIAFYGCSSYLVQSTMFMIMVAHS